MYREQINAYFDREDVRRELISAIGRLVGVKSVRGEAKPNAPFGEGPRACLDEAVRLCADLGFTAHDYDHYVGYTDLNDKPTQLHILGHLDVVGEGTGWDTDPYTCVEKDGVIYGRGVSDDKGPVCAALFAMKAIRDLEIPLSKNARLIMGTDEESGSEDIAYYYAREPFAPMTFTPDADFPVINIEKGHYHPDFGASWEPEAVTPRVSEMTGGFRVNVVPPEARAVVLGVTPAEVEKLCADTEARTGAKFTVTAVENGVEIHCLGRNAHAAMPEGGINAIQALLEVVSRLPLAECASTRAVHAMAGLFPFGDLRGVHLGIARSDRESGELTLNLALITLNDSGFTAKFDARVPVCANKQNCADACEENLGRCGIKVLGAGEMTNAHVVEADSPLVQTLLGCYSDFTGEQNPKPIAIGGGTYVHDIPGGVAFGCDFPDFDPKMHSANEQASVDNLIKSAKIFALAIARLCV